MSVTIAQQRLRTDFNSRQVPEPYELVFSKELFARVRKYLDELSRGLIKAGELLECRLNGSSISKLTELEFIRALLATKVPLIFAESAVSGDGSDWTLDELSMLGDIGIVSRVKVFDNGLHAQPIVHSTPLDATLMFIPGALLRSAGGVAADWDEVTQDGDINPVAYRALYERRLLPLLLHADCMCAKTGRQAFVTIPGLGCGQFAGPFRGILGSYLRDAIVQLLSNYHSELPNIRAVYFDPYSQCENERLQLGSISVLVRPLTQGNHPKGQLCHPVQYEESGDDFSGCDLFSVVAWDHVSWPGNDFYGGSRATDDGVKAAASSIMRCMTGHEGGYDTVSHCYLPPDGFHTWEDLVFKNKLLFGQSAEYFEY
ncbi:MAG: hypothetical protein OEZ68_01885 [Gammaproteobacteria bacterium]|nr:hypothetical protein [Gammaproteobacteria bacterium]MDH5799531.1 hypothetical protein [Gammaproteobacteria bacterium]